MKIAAEKNVQLGSIKVVDQLELLSCKLTFKYSIVSNKK